ncbi:MAG: glycerol-3-phosphate acyltransferase [Actinomycetota bacterium]|nr:glycerol-3-phosphate acyltransferase [Actinomycetota bacterium]
MIWLLLAPAYLLGTFPSAVMVARSKGIDIHTVGSGNPGASNIARTMGSRWGVLVFLLDGLKGAIPAAVGLAMSERPLAWGMVAAAVLGHMFPITRRFKGGKGVATMAGAALVLQLVVSAALFVVWFVVRKLSGKASLASLTIMAGLPLGVALRGGRGWEVGAIVGINLLVLVRHVDNIKRLVGGSELSASQQH